MNPMTDRSWGTMLGAQFSVQNQRRSNVEPETLGENWGGNSPGTRRKSAST